MTEIGDFEHIGSWIRQERKAQKRKQVDFAYEVGYSVAHVIHVEREQHIPSLTMVENMLNALGYKLVLGVERIDDGIDG